MPETPLPESEGQPLSGFEAVEASIEELDKQANSAWDEVNEIYDQASDDQKAKIDVLTEDHQAAADKADAAGQEELSMAAYLETRDDMPDGFVASLVEYKTLEAKMEDTQAQLEEHVPEKRQAVQEQASQLRSSLDYDKVIAAAFADDDHIGGRPEGVRIASINLLHEVSRAAALVDLLDGSETQSYYQLQSIENNVMKKRANWQEAGLLKDDLDEQQEVPFTLMTTEEIALTEERIKDVIAFRSKYGQPDEAVSNNTSAIVNLAREMQRPELNPQSLEELYRSSGIADHQPLTEAIKRRFTQLVGDLPAGEYGAELGSEAYTDLVEQARNIDAEKALDDIEIVGSFENLPFDYSQEDLKKFLLGSVPPIALASVKRIEFREFTPEEDDKGHTLGTQEWSQELGGSVLVISDVKVRENFEFLKSIMADSEDGDAIAEVGARIRMEGTMTHELGHALHEVLPVAALRRWEEYRASDPTNITSYVKSRHDQDHRNRYMEDFADTMNLFIKKPDELVITSPVRFLAMREIFEEFMPDYLEIVLPEQARKIDFAQNARIREGQSVEEVRAYYLRHEADTKTPELTAS